MYFYLIVNCLFACLLLLYYQKKNNAICKSQKKLHGKTAIVTGGTTGIGLRIAIDLASRGARVTVACPYEREGSNARRIIIKETGNREVHFRRLDLSNLKSVRSFAKDIVENESSLDILVNNAGIGAISDFMTEDGMSGIMQTNYYGHFLLTLLLLPLLNKSGTESEKSRIVNATSLMRSQGSLEIEKYNKIENLTSTLIYSNSKLCPVLFSKELTKRLKNHNVIINDADPGIVGTRIYQSHNYIVGYFAKWLLKIIFKNPWEGAQTAIHVAVDDDAGRVSGQVFGNCKIVSRNIFGDLDNAAEKLWEQSVLLVGLGDDEQATLLR